METVNCASHFIAFVRLVTSSHRLRVETGRWDKPVATEYKDRKCQLCNSGDIEDEYHFVLKCPVHSSIHDVYQCNIGTDQAWWNFKMYLVKKSAQVIKALAKCTNLAFRRRDEFLMQQKIYSSSAMSLPWYNRSMGHVAQGLGPPSLCPVIRCGHGGPLVVGVLWISPMDIRLLGGLQWPGVMGWVPGWWFQGGSLCGEPYNCLHDQRVTATCYVCNVELLNTLRPEQDDHFVCDILK